MSFTLLLMCEEGNRNHTAAKLLFMEPNTIGRKLGVGVRVASKMLMDRATRGNPSPAAQENPTTQQVAHQPPVYSAKGKAVAREGRKFGEALWKPVAHAGGVLWLEVTGLFFGIFTLFFASNTYKLRNAWVAGPDHQRFLVYSLVTLAFAYFTFSSFYRARKKEKLRNQKNTTAN
ncbi:MAG TPA: hypothetical protein VHB45_03605 [Alloacidobacterium sp.]|nr:hypothetical protein [Alloacidobacterium sp.]